MRRPVIASIAGMVALFVVAGGLGATASRDRAECPGGVCTVVERTTSTATSTRITTVPVATTTATRGTRTRTIREGTTTIAGGTEVVQETVTAPDSTSTEVATTTDLQVVEETATEVTSTTRTQTLARQDVVTITETSTQVVATTTVFTTTILWCGAVSCEQLTTPV